MTSRSTRRRIKNSEMPKLDEDQKEVDSEDEQSTLGRRKSLRHSPGSSSLSPPYKTRRIKESPNAANIDILTMSPLPPKKLKSPSKLPSHGSKKALSEDSEMLQNEIVVPKRNARNSPTSQPSGLRITRNSSVSPSNSPSKKTISKVLTNQNEAFLLKRNTRSKGNSPSGKEDQTEYNCKTEPSKPTRPSSSGSYIQENIVIDNPSTSQHHRQNLLICPEVLEKTNGAAHKPPVRTSKRKRTSPSKETHSTSNGKPHTDIPPCREKKLKCEREFTESSETDPLLDSCSSSSLSVHLTDTNSILLHDKISGENLKSTPNKASQEKNIKFSSKRRLDEIDPVLGSNSKKSKIEQPLPDTSAFSLNFPLNEKEPTSPKPSTSTSSNVGESRLEIASITIKETSDILTNAELLLMQEFGLSESQCIDICNVLSSELKDSSHIDIVEQLVKKLLLESTLILSMSSPRFNKFLRQLLTKYCTSNTSVEKKHLLCESALEWSKERKSVSLRHELELALMNLYFNTGFYRKAEETANGLYKETKKLQDKEKTVKACLCLSKAYHAMGNISKARASITTAKTEALKIYTPPDLQGELDLQSGIMQVAEEKDMETAFSYFKEAATEFTDRLNRSKALKYMLLAKLLVNRPDEGEKSVRSQSHVEDIDEGVEAMLSITKAAISCSLADFKKARERYQTELEEDIVVKGVLDQLYSKMLEKNLLNIIAPYEKMQISVVADKIGLDRQEIERRLSQMILDGEISAQLDHRDDCLYVYQPEEKDGVYDHALETVSQLDRTLSLLNRRVKQLL